MGSQNATETILRAILADSRNIDGCWYNEEVLDMYRIDDDVEDCKKTLGLFYKKEEGEEDGQ